MDFLSVSETIKLMLFYLELINIICNMCCFSLQYPIINGYDYSCTTGFRNQPHALCVISDTAPWIRSNSQKHLSYNTFPGPRWNKSGRQGKLEREILKDFGKKRLHKKHKRIPLHLGYVIMKLRMLWKKVWHGCVMIVMPQLCDCVDWLWHARRAKRWH